MNNRDRTIRYTELLWHDEEGKKALYDKIIPLLAKTRKGSNLSRVEHADRFIRKILIAFWKEVVEEMIYNNKTLSLKDDKIRICIAKLPIGKDPIKVARLMTSLLRYQPFVSYRDKVPRNPMRFKLSDKYKKMLFAELKRGHTYDLGKPIY